MNSWLYPISKRAKAVFRLKKEAVPVSLATYEMLLRDGRLVQDKWWGFSTNFRNVKRDDEIFIYPGDEDAGIVGYAKILEVDRVEQKLRLKFDLGKCLRLLSERLIPAPTVRRWIHYPRAAVQALSPFAADLQKRLPWVLEKRKTSGSSLGPVAGGAGFGSSVQNAKVEKAAVQFVQRWYQRRNWRVYSVERKKLGFDLICIKNKNEDRVEVKGVSAKKPSFILTVGELQKAKQDAKFVLCVVSSALSPKPQMQRWNGRQMLRAFTFRPLQFQAQLRQA